jgi:hypothetical protein
MFAPGMGTTRRLHDTHTTAHNVNPSVLNRSSRRV